MYLDKMNNSAADITPVSRTDLNKFNFDFVMSSVIGPRCLECHRNEKKDQPDLTDYAKLMRYVKPDSPSTSDLFTNLQGAGGDMPKKRPALGPNQLELLRLWILSGAPQNAGQGHAPGNDIALPIPIRDVEVEPNFASIKKNVLDLYCLKCHEPHPDKHKGPDRGIDFTTYETTMASQNDEDGGFAVVAGKPDDSAIVEVLQKGTMPRPKTESRLSANVAIAIATWITNGAKNDSAPTPAPTLTPAPLPTPTPEPTLAPTPEPTTTPAPQPSAQPTQAANP